MTEILLDVAGGVATITLDAAERRNAISPEMARQMVSALREVSTDPEVGALVIQARGPTFCAGAHLATLSGADEDPASPSAFRALSDIYASFVEVGEVAVPTVVAARGAAVGAGLNLLLAADLRIVAEDARLLSGFGRIGLHPGGGHFALLSRVVPMDVAAALGVFGQEISGQRAVELGLAWMAVEADNVESEALDLAATVAADPELARYTVRSFRQTVGAPGIPWHVAVESERPYQMWSLRRRAYSSQNMQ